MNTITRHDRSTVNLQRNIENVLKRGWRRIKSKYMFYMKCLAHTIHFVIIKNTNYHVLSMLLYYNAHEIKLFNMFRRRLFSLHNRSKPFRSWPELLMDQLLCDKEELLPKTRHGKVVRQPQGCYSKRRWVFHLRIRFLRFRRHTLPATLPHIAPRNCECSMATGVGD